MEYRVLPHTDLKVSRCSFGTMTLGSQADEAVAGRLIDQCFDAGMQDYRRTAAKGGPGEQGSAQDGEGCR
ncbi:MAG: hypothetical protein DMG24_21180 [Acidobacteria bacterium]|nr:MAG: hypothetical protein DMG24_21180 [Acidobacteriota bacterium]